MDGIGLTRALGVRGRDLAAVVPLMAIAISGTAHADPGVGEHAIDGIAYAAAIVGLASLGFWRRWSIAVVAVVAVTMTTYLGRDYPGGPALMAGPLALLALGYTAPRRVAWIGATGVGLVTTAGHIIAQGEVSIYDMVVIGWVLAAVLAGQALAARGERAAAGRELVAHQHEQALSTERLRIAQDLHDSVAHAMATINVQSGVAAHLLGRDAQSGPDQVRDSLEAIRSASAAALDELGTILGVLRDPGDAPRAPAAGLAQVVDLVDRARADGLGVTSTVVGPLDSVSPSIATAAYRVVQEALTNVRRHAGPGVRATVAVDVTPAGSLGVEVGDDGGATPGVRPDSANGHDGAGFGLIGMRERVEATGGALVTGPASPHGFRVRATWAAVVHGARTHDGPDA